MNITVYLLLIGFAICMIALYFDLRKPKSSTELSVNSNKSYNSFFEELMQIQHDVNNSSYSKPKVKEVILSEEYYDNLEQRFLNDIRESKKYKVKYEVDKTKPYNIFKLYERYSKVEIKSKTKQPLLLEYKQQNKIEIGEVENVKVNR